MKNIGDTLKKLREENGMTRKDAADKLKRIGSDSRGNIGKLHAGAGGSYPAIVGEKAGTYG